MKLIQSKLLSSVVHGFTTRQGGVSEEPYAGLNLGWQVGDRHSDVARNHQQVLQFLEWSPSRVASIQQVHSVSVAAIESGGEIANCDGVLTDQKGLLLWGYFADCAPIYFYDPQRTVIGLIHAGWRGTVNGIARNAVEKLKAEYGCRPGDLLVYIGPCIGKCCYEVNWRVADRVRDFPWWHKVLAPYGTSHFKFDLAECNLRILADAGVAPEQVEIASYCTSCSRELFFSHRRDGPLTGRMAGFVALP